MSNVLSPNRELSFDRPIGDGEGTYAQFIVDTQSPSPADVVYRKELRAAVIDMLATLPQRECSIILDRFGFDGRDQLTLEEISKKWHVGKERIRQLERDALTKLRVLFCKSSLPQEIFGGEVRCIALSAGKMFRGGNGKMPKRSTR